MVVFIVAIGLFGCGFFLEDRNVSDAPALELSTLTVLDLLRLPIRSGGDAVHIDAIEAKDRLDTSLGSGASTVILPTGSDVRFVGWAIDLTARHAADAAFISVDRGKPTACAYGFDRPDVATAYDLKNDNATGLQCDVQAASLRPGRHHVRFSIVNAAGTAYESIDLPQTFLVNASTS